MHIPSHKRETQMPPSQSGEQALLPRRLGIHASQHFPQTGGHFLFSETMSSLIRTHWLPRATQLQKLDNLSWLDKHIHQPLETSWLTYFQVHLYPHLITWLANSLFSVKKKGARSFFLATLSESVIYEAFVYFLHTCISNRLDRMGFVLFSDINALSPADQALP
jgi:hypothetical protein